MQEKKIVVLTVRVEESLYKALQEMAAEDERKLSPFVAKLLRAQARAAGKLRESEKSKGARKP